MNRYEEKYLEKQLLELFSKKKGALNNFWNFTGKHLCWSLFLMKVQKETPTLVCSCEIYEIFKNTYFEEQQEAVSVYSSSCF